MPLTFSVLVLTREQSRRTGANRISAKARSWVQRDLRLRAENSVSFWPYRLALPQIHFCDCCSEVTHFFGYHFKRVVIRVPIAL